MLGVRRGSLPPTALEVDRPTPSALEAMTQDIECILESWLPTAKAMAGHTPSDTRSSDPLGVPRMPLIESVHDTKVIQ